MKPNFLTGNKSYDSDYFLKLALVCRRNALRLRDSSKLIFDKEYSQNHALFLLYTAFEELQKGIFCLFVHRGFMIPKQITPIFSKHEAKIILFEKIFRNPSFCIRNGEFFIDGILLEKLDFEKIIKENRDFIRKYMDKRNDCLYVRPNPDGTCYIPTKKLLDADKQRESIIEELTALNAYFDIIWSHDFEGNFDDFQYYNLTPKGKPKTHHVTFAGTGQLYDRKNYKPQWVEKFFETLEY